jgi:pyruvate dehydrogenase E2 component (dihydrolipoamide acetyltransferase)
MSDKKTEMTPQGVPVVESIPLRGIARLTAQFMAQSHQEYAALTGMVELDFTNLVAFREGLMGKQSADAPRTSMTHLMIKILALALKDHPRLNASFIDDQIKMLGEINIGMAVALENGELVVPVIRNADALSIEEITLEAERLSNKIRGGKIDLEDVSGGTFTFSNFGMFGGDIATPLINPPQTAILALGRIIPKPVVMDGEIVIRKMGWISLTCDHRIINGVQAAMFSRSLNEMINDPIHN